MTRARGHTGPALTTILLIAGAPLALAVPQAAAEDPTCQGQPATIVGTEYADPLHGTPGDDVVWLGGTALEPGGVDTFDGGDGDDLICQGGTGQASVQGDAGNDRYYGTGYGTGGPGNDEFVTTPNGRSSFWGGDGDDELTGSVGSDELVGGDGADRTVAGGGDDRILEGPGSDRVDTGEGNDVVRYSGHRNGDPTPLDYVSDGIHLDVRAGTVESGPDLDTVTDNECWVGTSQDDYVDGSFEADCFDGAPGPGKDQVTARGGDDVITVYSGRVDAGSGDDYVRGEFLYRELSGVDNAPVQTSINVFGHRGDDHLRVYAAEGSVWGGTGHDILDLGSYGRYDDADSSSSSWRIDVQHSARPAAANGLVSGSPGEFNTEMWIDNLEEFRGSRFDDVFRGSRAGDIFEGRNGDDRANGRPGNDRLEGGPGRDVVEGGRGDDVLKGGLGGPDFADGDRGRDRCIAERREECEA